MEIFTRNFLQKFEAEKAQVLSGAFAIDTAPTHLETLSSETLASYTAVDPSQYGRVPNDEKLVMFRTLYRPLEVFADVTAANLRIVFYETINKGEIQLKYHTLNSTMCTENEWHQFLALLFQMYDQFSIEVVDTDYIMLKFFVDMTGETSIDEYKKHLNSLCQSIGISKEFYDFDL
ncbi:hypothetical protein RFF05_16010 [Bengtsoniella intestinalis]|uniref:hypothetical protein n=1 Tax=Bengtsoniella intestinalis TaxID=3073143 RepID=UPI00391F3387